MSETSTQRYPKYHGPVMDIKSEQEQTDSKEWFQNETKYNPATAAVKLENATTVEAFVCGICSEHASCKDGSCEHQRLHCCLNIKSEPDCTEEDIKTDNITSDYKSSKHVA